MSSALNGLVVENQLFHLHGNCNGSLTRWTKLKPIITLINSFEININMINVFLRMCWYILTPSLVKSVKFDFRQNGFFLALLDFCALQTTNASLEKKYPFKISFRKEFFRRKLLQNIDFEHLEDLVYLDKSIKALELYRLDLQGLATTSNGPGFSRVVTRWLISPVITDEMNISLTMIDSENYICKFFCFPFCPFSPTILL